jgi:hypothetical protein
LLATVRILVSGVGRTPPARGLIAATKIPAQRFSSCPATISAVGISRFEVDARLESASFAQPPLRSPCRRPLIE